MLHHRLGFLLLLVTLGFGLSASLASAQVRLDSSFAFLNDPAKKFAVYVPSGYSPDVATKAMVAFHPLHANWGNSTTWCDILTPFAEENNLLLFCPDGGNDGRVDDAIDKAFTTALIDSVASWYSINPHKLFALGFSWGARATYTYGLDNAEKFAGFITIGAFINGTAQVGMNLLSRAQDKPFFIMHGDRDNTVNLATGFFPIRDALIDAGAQVNSLILQGVGHTIHFPDRDQRLTRAFRWVDSTSTALSVNIEDTPPLLPKPSFLLSNLPNPFHRSTQIRYVLDQPAAVRLTVYDIQGRRLAVLVDATKGPGRYEVPFDAALLSPGLYFYQLSAGRFHETKAMLLAR